MANAGYRVDYDMSDLRQVPVDEPNSEIDQQVIFLDSRISLIRTNLEQLKSRLSQSVLASVPTESNSKIDPVSNVMSTLGRRLEMLTAELDEINNTFNYIFENLKV